MIHNIR